MHPQPGPWTLTHDLDLRFKIRAKLNQSAKYLGQKSFSSKVIVQTHRETNTHRTDSSTWPTKAIDSGCSVIYARVNARLWDLLAIPTNQRTPFPGPNCIPAAPRELCATHVERNQHDVPSAMQVNKFHGKFSEIFSSGWEFLTKIVHA